MKLNSQYQKWVTSWAYWSMGYQRPPQTLYDADIALNYPLEEHSKNLLADGTIYLSQRTGRGQGGPGIEGAMQATEERNKEQSYLTVNSGSYSK